MNELAFVEHAGDLNVENCRAYKGEIAVIMLL